MEKAQKIFTQLVGAVSYVHNKSCVHRDLKLENILLDRHENVKLCDFGFTREYEGKASYLQTYCGTVCYAAPEMLKGEKYAGEKVDVWSLGVILYALLTGELPFDDDDDNVTKMKILTMEPKFPDHIPAEAKSLLGLLLSKRPLLRPSLSEILANPFLAEHAPNQQAILKLQQPAPFTTRLEKDTLDRMRSAGVDIDKVIENVLAQRCDSLAGWWALLIEKEERKEMRRERKRKQKEAEARNSRRLSATSALLERMAPTLKEIDEEGWQRPIMDESPRSRGRRENRASRRRTLSIPLEWSCRLELTGTALSLGGELPQLPQIAALEPPGSPTPPPPIEKDPVRSPTSSPTQRPVPPPKEMARRSRNSNLHMVSTNAELLSPNTIRKRRRSRWQQHPILNQLAQMKQWLAKRAKSPSSKDTSPRVEVSGEKGTTGNWNSAGQVKEGQLSELRLAVVPPSKKAAPAASQHESLRPRRGSVSPAPVTPHASFRRTSAGLRGRKSTSSSISSVRSVHHRHSHSKASSTSSNSMTSTAAKTPRSPRSSVKVLPGTPTASTFPSNIRVVRAPIQYNEPASFGPHSPGPVFAKRKKRPFKGPTLHLGTGISSSVRRDSSTSRSASAAGRRSGEIIEEEDEDDIEEVDAFSPVVGPGEVEETIEEAPG